LENETRYLLNAKVVRRKPHHGLRFSDIASTASVKAAQEANGSRSYFAEFKGKRQFNKFGAAEAAFIRERDSFYIATVSETGWPYVQHRGGPRGFLRVLDEFAATGNTSPWAMLLRTTASRCF